MTQRARRESLRRWARLACFGVLFAASIVHAQAPDARRQAGELFGAGVEAFGEARYEEALEAFEGAYRLAPHYAVRLNMAACFAKLERPVEALFNYERFLHEGGSAISADERRSIEKAMAALEKQVGQVEVVVKPESATVHIGGSRPRELPDGRMVLAEGRYEVEAFALGYESHHGSVEVHGGEHTFLRIALLPVMGVAELSMQEEAAQVLGSPEAGEDGPPRDGRPWWQSRTTHWAFAGAGLALGVTAVATGSAYLAARNRFDDAVERSNDPSIGSVERAEARIEGEQEADRADALARATNVLGITAGSLGAGAFIMWLVTRHRERAPAAAVSPVAGRGFAGLQLQLAL